jgi:hypothetical protein
MRHSFDHFRARWKRPTAALLTCLTAAAALTAADFAAVPAGSEETVWSLASFGDGDYFYEPSDMAVDRNLKRIYVAETGNHRVSVFDFQGKWIAAVGGRGQGPGEFSRPTGIWVLEDSSLAVADFDNHRIQIFDRDGGWLKAVGTQALRVADLVVIDGLYYTISTFGNSGFSLNMGSEENHQPLVTVLDGKGETVRTLETADFPDTHPFIRSIKHRVNLALSPDGRLFLPYFSINLTLVYGKDGKEAGRFECPLAFKPREPKLQSQRSGSEGRVAMRADVDLVCRAAQFGPDGRLYLLTFTKGYEELMKGVEKPEDRPLFPMRFDVIDASDFKPVRVIACRPGTNCFAVLDRDRLAYIHEDEAGDVVLRCIRF